MNSSCQQQPFPRLLSYLLRGLCHPTERENDSHTLALQRGPSQHRSEVTRATERPGAGGRRSHLGTGRGSEPGTPRMTQHRGTPAVSHAGRRLPVGLPQGRDFSMPPARSEGRPRPCPARPRPADGKITRPSLPPAAKRQRDAPGARLTLKTMPAMVVPVLRAVGSRRPFCTSSASSKEFLKHRVGSEAARGLPPAIGPASRCPSDPALASRPSLTEHSCRS